MGSCGPLWTRRLRQWDGKPEPGFNFFRIYSYSQPFADQRFHFKISTHPITFHTPPPAPPPAYPVSTYPLLLPSPPHLKGGPHSPHRCLALALLVRPVVSGKLETLKPRSRKQRRREGERRAGQRGKWVVAFRLFAGMELASVESCRGRLRSQPVRRRSSNPPTCPPSAPLSPAHPVPSFPIAHAVS